MLRAHRTRFGAFWILTFLTLLLGCEADDNPGSLQRTIGFSGDEAVEDFKRTADGGFIVVGYTNSVRDNDDLFLVKTDANWNVEWSKAFGSESQDRGFAVRQTSDGGFIAVGSIFTDKGGKNVYIVKTDRVGQLEWTKTFGGANGDTGYGVVETHDGGFAVVGTFGLPLGFSSVYLLKTDIGGRLQWSKTYGGIGDQGRFISLAHDGGFVLGGVVDPPGAQDWSVYFLKTDEQGNEIWSRLFDIGGNRDVGMSMQRTSDGGYVITGSSFTAGPPANTFIYTIKTDGGGNQQWTNFINLSHEDIGTDIVETDDGGYAIAGVTQVFGRGPQVLLVKINAAGVTNWTQIFGGTSTDLANAILVAPGGGYFLAGTTASQGAGGLDMYFVKTDRDGNVSDP